VREEAFKSWLAQAHAENTVKTALYRLKKVEIDYGDLDKIYDEGKFDELDLSLTYSKSDENLGKPNPSKIELTSRVRETLTELRTSARKYRSFREQEADDTTEAAIVMDFISILSIFVMACFVGYYVVWSVTPALHTPLMAVTNAISSVIVVGALIAAAAAGSAGVQVAGAAGVVLASINIFGGFAVTARMLAMYKKKDRYGALEHGPSGLGAARLSRFGRPVHPRTARAELARHVARATALAWRAWLIAVLTTLVTQAPMMVEGHWWPQPSPDLICSCWARSLPPSAWRGDRPG
jgi:NAD(P) transhydrogenase subunit alpha